MCAYPRTCYVVPTLRAQQFVQGMSCIPSGAAGTIGATPRRHGTPPMFDGPSPVPMRKRGKSKQQRRRDRRRGGERHALTCPQGAPTPPPPTSDRHWRLGFCARARARVPPEGINKQRTRPTPNARRPPQQQQQQPPVSLLLRCCCVTKPLSARRGVRNRVDD